ncbi:U-scoloptoxin(05)-Sm1a-like [Panonychus citri]|uniref:U-scoloptoxin(05)-Sm1a-like n=1 Tax=Panonychus citri TaxID=50023 RepID=UPI0023072F5C|nr:U-scoloptoxin(05)-Sm1a-like [Panonychus citri]
MSVYNNYLHLVILVTSIVYCQSLDCYICSSDNDTDCSEIFDKEHAKLQPVSCDIYGAEYCIKTTGIYEGSIGVKRFCSSRKFEDYCDYIKRKGDNKPQRSCVYSCSSDGCNRGDNLSKLNSHLTFISLILFCYNLLLIK